MAQTTVKVGILGCGIGLKHLECCDTLKPQVEIVGICNLVVERTQKQATKNGVKNVYADYKELPADKTLDAVSVCVPNDLRAQLSVDALKAQKHVLCENPMTDTLTHAQEIVAATEKFPKKFVMAMNNRFSGETQTLKAIIDAGTLGETSFAKTEWTRRSDKQPICTAMQGLHMLQIINALYTSAETGKEVVIER